MKYFVYILRSLKDGKRYIGFTSDLNRRIEKHKAGLVKSTKSRSPLELTYTESFDLKTEAMNREKFFKTHKGRDYLDSIEK